jgi:hypothetical protein
MQTKTEKAIEFYTEGSFPAAFRIFKTFRLGITKEEKRTLEIAHECVSGKGSFYKGLGIDGEEEIEKAKVIIEKKFVGNGK